MKKRFVNILINYIKKNKYCSEIELEKLKYGFGSLYIQITKMIVISLLAIILKIFKEYIIFVVFYNILRKPSFGLHAKKSSHCWIWSMILFIGIPLMCKYLTINYNIKQIISIICVLLIFIFAPADTIKKPIVSEQRRNIYNFLSTLIAIIYFFTIELIDNNLISNCIFFSLILQNIIINPITYKIFNLPYNNYKEYLRKEAENV